MHEAHPQLVLLDRDGVINYDSPEYVKSVEEWLPIPGALDAIARLQAAGIAVAVCSNQAGIGRGIVSPADLRLIHRAMNAHLLDHGGRPVDVFFCPHHPDRHCACRKPAPLMLTTAMASFRRRPAETLYIGDSAKDLMAARAAACDFVLVKTGNGAEVSRTVGSDVRVHADLADAADHLLGGTLRSSPVETRD